MGSRRSIFVVLIVAVAFTTAEPPRYRLHNSRLQQRRPFFARQESAPAEPQPDVALYPSANELKPENPFQAEEEITEPELVYGPPDSLYGPPLPETDSLTAVEEAPQFAPNPDAEEFASIQIQRPSRLQQSPRKVQQRAQLHLVQRPQRLQQRRRQQQRATIRQVVSVPQQRASIKQVVRAQRIVAKPARAAALIVSAPSVASASAITPSKVVISSERLVAVESPPAFSAAIDVPFGESYVVINSPFGLNSKYQPW
ncbi:uncharacterized protein [Eurosta solidaginis]|uniref:uncharacterized protein n=1 Tax=Eurosta solidaginis TaxID=178769 RepID=UPI003530F62D